MDERYRVPARYLPISVLFVLSCGFCAVPPASGADAPVKIVGWRGDGSGHYPNATPPIEWDGETKKNILWCTKIGRNKFSSPIVTAGKVFLMADPAAPVTDMHPPAALVCVDADSGKILWQQSDTFADLPTKVEPKPARGSPGNTTPTPVCDGQFIYVSYGCGIVACHDLQGQRKWIQYLEHEYVPQYGRASSPVLVGDKLLVSIACLTALDAKTGKLVWKNEKDIETYGTPLPVKIGGVDMVLAPSGHLVRVADGVTVAESKELKYTTPIVHETTAYMVDTSTFALALPTQAADKLELKRLWIADLEGLFYGSGIYDNGLIYAVNNGGHFYILDAKDGNLLVDKELDIPSGSGRPNLPPAEIYPSLVLAGKYLFLSNTIGNVLVLQPGREYKEIKRNLLEEGSGGTPAFAGSRIYVRGGPNLYCIGEK
ncbi:MAG: PQQ-binding-like beta-propeller repeat protein [Planctomycetota bacterium]|nr:PQQ-binding-like beta-propeller repeat protein [Planctomycetota bacterium]